MHYTCFLWWWCVGVILFQTTRITAKKGGARVCSKKKRVAFNFVLNLLFPQPILSLGCVCLQFGRFFQIRDDYMDLVSEEYSHKKGGCGSDLRSGTWSYPVVSCVQQHPETKSLFLSVFDPDHATTDADCAHLISILKNTGSLDHTVKKLQVRCICLGLGLLIMSCHLLPHVWLSGAGHHGTATACVFSGCAQPMPLSEQQEALFT